MESAKADSRAENESVYFDASDSRNASGFLRGSAGVRDVDAGITDEEDAIGCFERGPGLRRLGFV